MLFSTRFLLAYDGRNFTFNHLHIGTSNENIYEIAQAINSLQDKNYNELIKIESEVLE